MSESRFINNELYAPYFIFLRSVGHYSDANLLQRFGLGSYQPVTTTERLSRCAIIADDGQWTMLADDWYYTLWHRSTTRPTLAEFAQGCDVFACSVGDCDQSFDYMYYRDGKVARHYAVEHTDDRGTQVMEDFGALLPDEAAAFQHTDEMQIVLTIAASLGINMSYTERDVRLYAPIDSDS